MTDMAPRGISPREVFPRSMMREGVTVLGMLVNEGFLEMRFWIRCPETDEPVMVVNDLSEMPNHFDCPVCDHDGEPVVHQVTLGVEVRYVAGERLA